MLNFRNLKLSVKLPLLIVIAAAIVAFIITLFEILAVTDTITHAENEANFNSVQSYASSVHFYVNEASSIIQITADNNLEKLSGFTISPNIVPDESNNEIRDLAASILNQSSVFEYITFINVDGSIQVIEPRELQYQLTRNDIAFTAWYKKLMNTRQTVISDLHISVVTQRPSVIVAVSVHNPSGQIAGIWAGGLKLENLSQIGKPEDQRERLRRYGFITDSRGLIIAHQANPDYVIQQTDFSSVPLVKAALSGKQGTLRFINPIDQIEELGAFTPVADLNWAAAYVIPVAIAFQHLDNLQGYLIVLAAVMVLLMAFGGVLIARQVIKPLKELCLAAEKIGAGDLSRRIDIHTGDEIGVLGSKFNEMATALSDKTEQLQGYAAGLERKVEERTGQLKQSEERYRQIIQTSPVGMYTIKDETIQFANKSFADIVGAETPEQLVGIPIWQLIPSEYKAQVRGKMQLAKTLQGPVPIAEEKFTKLDGSVIDVAVSGISLNDLGRNEDLVVIQDITARKLSEQALQQRTTDLERSNAELERFAYVASHDLQEPLRMVSSYTQLLERRYKDKLDTDANDFINFAVDGAKRMQNLINDLLTYSRVGTRGKPFERTDCNDVLDAAIANLDTSIKESNARVTYDSLPVVMADEGQLVQLFQNLIGNAIKFHDKQLPEVKVSAKQDGDKWVFSIKDNGIGIDPQYFDRVFVIFQRLQGSNYPGTGIGLSISKKIVERHDGRYWIESQPGKGSTFYFTLPKTIKQEENVEYDRENG